jgi:HPt (histidine-containing phosphotransfer) domain-containing protein
VRNLNLRNDGPGWSNLKSAGFDPEALWKRVEGDPKLLRGLIEVFETEFPGMLAGATRAIQNHDGIQLERAAHKIKGAVLQFSASGAVAMAVELERLGRSGTVAGASGTLEKLKSEVQGLVEALQSMSRGIRE